MSTSPQTERLRVQVKVSGSGSANVDTGFPVLDRLLSLFAEYADFDLVVAIAPGRAADDAAAAAGALGEELSKHLQRPSARGYGSAVLPAGEALAHVALEVSDRPLLVSNVDLSDAKVGGLGTDVVTDFLRRLAVGAGITLHVRLIAGDDAQHVLEAMFKALGVAVSQACRPRRTRQAGKE
jgi:imidazoleglycerol-phosphate dehydratase